MGHRFARTFAAGACAAAFLFAALPAAAQYYTLPEGTQISSVLASDDIDTKTAQIGDGFTMDIVAPYPNGDANFAGAKLRGHVSDVQAAGQGKPARLRLIFDSIVFPNGQSAPISAAVTQQTAKNDNGSAGSVVGLLGGAAGGYLYAANNKPNFDLARGAAVSVQTTSPVEIPRRQAAQ